MAVGDERDFDRILFDSGSIRVGAFRCDPHHPSFHDSGPARNFCFVFPRTGVEIQHEHEPAFVANPNVVTFYNRGQAYLRRPVGVQGDRCDWFGVDIDIVRDVVRTFDPSVDARPDAPFRLTHGWSDAGTYLLQRQVFGQVANGATKEPLAVEERVLNLLESVVRTSYGTVAPAPRSVGRKRRDIVRHIEYILSDNCGEQLTLREIAAKVEISVFHLCRLFRRATGTTLNRYRQKLLIRRSLESILESRRPLVDIAFDAGFSSHSHFTSTFHREFAQTPSRVRAG